MQRTEQMISSEETIRKLNAESDALRAGKALAEAQYAESARENQALRTYINTIMSLPGMGLMLQQNAGMMQQLPFLPDRKSVV